MTSTLMQLTESYNQFYALYDFEKNTRNREILFSVICMLEDSIKAWIANNPEETDQCQNSRKSLNWPIIIIMRLRCNNGIREEL